MSKLHKYLRLSSQGLNAELAELAEWSLTCSVPQISSAHIKVLVIIYNIFPVMLYIFLLLLLFLLVLFLCVFVLI